MRRSAREAILDAADHLLAQYGFSKVTMEEVAREAGVGRTTIYLHFATREELGLACVDRMHLRLMEVLTAICRRPIPASERIGAMLEARVLFAFDQTRERPVRREDELFAAIRPAYRDRRQAYLDREARLFAEVVQEGCDAGELAAEDPERVGMALVLATNALMPYSLTPRQRADRAVVEEAVRSIVRLLLDGLRVRDLRPCQTPRDEGDRR